MEIEIVARKRVRENLDDQKIRGCVENQWLFADSGLSIFFGDRQNTNLTFSEKIVSQAYITKLVQIGDVIVLQKCYCIEVLTGAKDEIQYINIFSLRVAHFGPATVVSRSHKIILVIIVFHFSSTIQWSHSTKK